MRPLLEPMIVSVSGRDRPGILSVLAGILAQEEIELVDIEQATLQDFLALSFLVDLRHDAARSRALLQRFFPEAKNLGLSVEIRPISQDELRTLKDHDLWALTVLGTGDIATTVAEVSTITARHQANIVSIRRLAEEDIRAAEFIVDASRVDELREFRSDLLAHGQQAAADIALSREDAYRRSKRVVVMDADSTLFAGEAIDALAERAGVADEVRAITHRAMEGELDFADSLRQRVAKLAGLDEGVLSEVAEAMALTPGAEETVAALKALGLKVGVISGGFEYFTEHLRRRLDLDYAYGNRLEVVDGQLTGRLEGPVLDGAAKAERLQRIADAERVHSSQVVGVGDGANDIPMLRRAGLGVAFRARESTRQAADAAIHQDNLKVLLYLLGVSAKDLRRLTTAREQEARGGSTKSAPPDPNP